MSKQDNDKDYIDPKVRIGHFYDGIEELDHAPPKWFTALFYTTVAFGIGYFLYYSVGDGPGLTTEYFREKAADETVQATLVAKAGSGAVNEDTLKGFLKDEGKKKLGAQVYQSKCVSCHGAQGQGGIGPNLTDDHWIHGAKLTEMVDIISKGVGDKGMPPWGPIMSVDEIQAVSVYIRTLHGTHPAGAKEPQGDLVKPETL